MLSLGETFRIGLYVFAIGFVSFDRRKAKQSNGDVRWSCFTNTGKAKRGGRRRLVRQEIAMMRAAVFLDQFHPNARVLFEVSDLIWIDCVTNEAGNHR